MAHSDKVATFPSPGEFLAAAERITNDGRVDEFLALFSEDCVAEWILDGAVDTHRGIDEIRTAAVELFTVCHELGLHVDKTLECADGDTLACTWTGGFNGGTRQFGTEIWTFRDGLVVRHRMYSYLDVRPSSSPWATLRLACTAPKVVGALLRYRITHRRRHTAGSSARPATHLQPEA
ncbi:nuclear transport factor 2 family protein [Millisia brevis]|uniref:nuclear transport factor 2 family protein n=1 Tax=Millisia brevis TaxID=264148 RepID=UPI00082F035E|nr:nuclear transport factor 2 family protein [Millisia brevis]